MENLVLMAAAEINKTSLMITIEVVIYAYRLVIKLAVPCDCTKLAIIIVPIKVYYCAAVFFSVNLWLFSI
jgi:hypothetical protein